MFSSEPTLTPQSIKTLDSGVDNRKQLLPTSLHPPSDVILIHWSFEVHSLWIFLPTALIISFLSFRLFLINAPIFLSVRDLIGGVRATFGIQPICFVISRRVAPCLPITRPGFSASMITSPETGSK